MGTFTDNYHEPFLSKGVGWKGDRLYRNYLRGEMRQNGLGTEQSVRSNSFRDIGQQQAQADLTAKQTLNQGFGSQNPTGLSAAYMSQNALAAPYGEANLAAQEAGRRAAIQTGSAYEASNQNKVNLYNSRLDPLLQERALQLQQAALESQAGMAVGGSSGGGGILSGLL